MVEGLRLGYLCFEDRDVLAYKHLPELLRVGAWFRGRHGDEHLEVLAVDLVKHGQSFRQAVGGGRLRNGRNYQQVAIFGDVFEIRVAQAALGVDDDVLEVSNMVNHLDMADNFEGQARPVAALAPFGWSSDLVAVDHQRGRDALQEGRKMNSRSGFSDAPLVAGYSDDHVIPSPIVFMRA